MDGSQITIAHFDVASASETDFVAFNRFHNVVQAETMPDDPLTPLQQTIAGLKNIPPDITWHVWVGWTVERQEIVAGAFVSYKTNENKHLINVAIHVHPEYRRQGLGRELVRCVAALACKESRSLITASTNDRVPGGEAFMVRLGAERGLEFHEFQLHLDEVDRTKLAMWQEEAHLRLQGLTLDRCIGAYPTDRLNAIANLHGVHVNTQPLGTLEIEKMCVTPENLRELEQTLAATGTERWSIFAKDLITEEIIGIIEVTWNPNSPHIVNQGVVTVLPESRGKGYGRCLKVAMLTWILNDRRDARYIRTGTADTNASLLEIDASLGFKPYMSAAVWQVTTDKVLEYLKS